MNFIYNQFESIISLLNSLSSGNEHTVFNFAKHAGIDLIYLDY